MVGAAILDGDLVVVHPQPQADSGKIVVALLEDVYKRQQCTRQPMESIWRVSSLARSMSRAAM